jgi:hypothetical protein
MNSIITALKNHPTWDIARISLLMNISTIKVGDAQRAHIRPFLKRDNVLCGKDNVSVSKLIKK